MKIKDNRQCEKFEDLNIGDVFAFGDDYYLKISSDSAFDLEANVISSFHDEDCGILLNVELIVRG